MRWLIMLTIAIAAGPVFADEPPSMTIRILNQADASANRLRTMKHFVENAFLPIVGRVKWIECAVEKPACEALRGANEFWLRLVAQPLPEGQPTDTAGFTDRTGIPCVNIFYPIVERVSKKWREDLLGAAVAHEIGHLYLGEDAHSAGGIMRATWTVREIDALRGGVLGFTREQQERIRAAVLSQRMIPH